MPPPKKKKQQAGESVHNSLGTDELSLIAQFVMSQNYSCDATAAFLSHFAKPGVWRIAAEKLGWGSNVTTRKDFVDRCLRERQNWLASQYNDQTVLSREGLQAQLRAVWNKSNAWVVPGIVLKDHTMTGPDEGLPYVLKGTNGKQTVVLMEPGGPDVKGVAMVKTGPMGTQYGVQIKGSFLMLRRR